MTGKLQSTIVVPKFQAFQLQSVTGSCSTSIIGIYQLANLLQELSLAERKGLQFAVISGARIVENPVDRIQRRIREEMWDVLSRELKGERIVDVARDPKDANLDARPRIYIPVTAPEQYQYYLKASQDYPEIELDIRLLPRNFSGQYSPWNVNEDMGILALQVHREGSSLHPLQYIVPGHRFNEFYGWDSYFCALGLLEVGRVDMAVKIVQHYIFQIQHYGAILNANRSYYLGRSHPPFLTDLVLRTYEHLKSNEDKNAENFLRSGILAAIREYHNVWMSEPRLDLDTGLTRYRANQRGIPPEVEPGHFDWFLKPFAEDAGMTIIQLIHAYNTGSLKISRLSELDEFFKHDGSIRESGHDTSYRLEGQSADLVTIDLNSLLYKYEIDIAEVIDKESLAEVDAEFEAGLSSEMYRSSYWLKRASERKRLVNKYLWDDERGMFLDYNTKSRQRTGYKTVTTFWALWSGLASADQAAIMVERSLPQFENIGGVSSTVRQPYESGGPAQRQRQWDFPFGWAPHQITIWDGLRRYGYDEAAKRLVYRWLYLVTRIAVDYNGTITEKYDVTQLRMDPSVHAEYGNLGSDFQGVSLQGFGWTNASYSYGLAILDERLRAQLAMGLSWSDQEKQQRSSRVAGQPN